LALVFLWLGRSAEHEAFCRQVFSAIARSDDPSIHDRAAKAYLLRPNPEPDTLKLACASARRSLELAQTGDANLPWFQTVAGVAAFREGKFAQADALLTEALANPIHENQRRLALAFRAMARARDGRSEEAGTDQAELAKLNLALPQRTQMSSVVRDQDQLAVRLAYKEVVSLSQGPSSLNR
jgi:hypothetical protein